MVVAFRVRCIEQDRYNDSLLVWFRSQSLAMACKSVSE